MNECMRKVDRGHLRVMLPTFAVYMVLMLYVSRQTVNAVETGKYDPSLPLAFKLARLFKQRIESMFDPDGGH